jgi:integral membrane protein
VGLATSHPAKRVLSPWENPNVNSRIVSAFRIIAFVEAVTWLGLLIGMYFKWIEQTGEAGVKIFGPIHGGVFIAYILLAIVTSRIQRWSFWTTAFALGASIPPFFTVWFEIWAKRSGRLEPVIRPVVAVAA